MKVLVVVGLGTVVILSGNFQHC